jgi:hypothetical protein
MKWLAVVISIFCVPVIPLAQSTPAQPDAALSQLVDAVLHDVATLRPGMRRSALNTLFIQDAGLQFFGESRYDYRRCPSIKISVKFKPVSSEEKPDDVIVEISRPYLESPFKD